ncbi:MAG: penicillin-binding protein activator [Mariprofundus sp.]|nr:penicillin-binding protein activator [Mariprofundus sp.]
MPIMLLAAASALLLLSACQPKTPSQTSSSAAQNISGSTFHMVAAPQSAAEIQALMQQAQAGADLNTMIQQLETLMQGDVSLIRQEAAFRRAQLMLEHGLPKARDTMLKVMQMHQEHALIPYAHLWLARWWLQQDDGNRALEHLTLALQHPRLTHELVDEVFDTGPALLQNAEESTAIAWLLAAAQIDTAGRDSWLRMAARRASMTSIKQHMTNGSLSSELLPLFALYAGRAHLMNGDVAGVADIAALLSTLMPQSHENEQLQAWASGKISAATIGVMLPLTGRYARYGQQALRGIRLSLAALAFDKYITLRIEDTASQPAGAIKAYRQLANESVNIIVGPLLADATEAIIPYLKPAIPVISLTGRTHLAQRSPALFIHTLSPLVQIDVMALYAWNHQAKRMVVITTEGESQKEAAMFTASFEALGGEVLETLSLEPGKLDFRDQLRQLRFATDDDVLLSELDEDLNVFLPDMDMEIHMPVNFDAIYLALKGQKIALLAGQLAYADISHIPLYGSNRWQDGHLLDDRGRYLSRARFAGSSISQQTNNEDPAIRQFKLEYRDVWGDENTSQLMNLAYDTMRIATIMTSRLGLKKQALLLELRDQDGFPAMTGHVRFDAAGVGQKQLDIFSIKKGKIVPAG